MKKKKRKAILIPTFRLDRPPSIYRRSITAVDPRTRNTISFESIDAACKFLGIGRGPWFLEQIYQRRIFHGYVWWWTHTLPQFLDWELDRYAPWIPPYLERTKVETQYKEASISGVQFRLPSPCFTL